MRATVITASCTVLLAATLYAQSPDQLGPFSEAVRAYQAGDLKRASDLLARWSSRDLERIVPAVVASRNWSFVKAAAMLHSELALHGTAVDDLPAIGAYLGLAETFVKWMPDTESPFRRHWYRAAASILLAHASPAGARRLVDRGLRLFPADAPLHLMAGVVEETMAHVEDPECSGPGCESRGPSSRSLQMLREAEAEYRRALDLDTKLLEARLRLGRVLFFANQRGRARDELNTVAGQSADVRIQYLARLFLGALADYENDFTAARREYEAALNLAPQHETAYLALGFAEQMTGDVAKARQTVSTMTDRPAGDVVDPWLDYLNGTGLNGDSLQWLREQVQP